MQKRLSASARCCLLLSALTLAPIHVPAAVLTLAPSQDAYISEHSELPTGLSAELVIGTQGISAELAHNRGLIRFDGLVQIPAGAVITSVTLKLNVNKVPLGAPEATFDLHRMLAGWDDLESTWTTRLGADAWTTPGGAGGIDFADTVSASVDIPFAALYTFGSTPALIEDVTAWVNDPSSNHGWMIKTADEDLALSARRFAANDGLFNRPSLEVSYEVPDASLRIAGPAVAADRFCFSFEGQAGKTYFVERRADLGPSGIWSFVTNLPPTTSAGTITVCEPLVSGRQCYRVGQR